MSIGKTLLAAVVGAFSIAGTASAQAVTPQRSFAICWLCPGPLAHCNTWLVTEAAVEIPFTTTKHIISAGGTEERTFTSGPEPIDLADARVDLHEAGGRTIAAGFIGARASSVAAPVAALVTFGVVAAFIIGTAAGY